MNPSRPAGGTLRTWSTGLFHCMDDPGNCKCLLLLLLLLHYLQSNGCHGRHGHWKLWLLTDASHPFRSGLITCLCPCITFGQIADIVDKGTCCEFFLSSP
jgi:hypothetical protein